jgi:hypothetical protein
MTMGWEQEPEIHLESITVFGVEVRAGIRSKLSPQKSADIMDMALKGKAAIVKAIESDRRLTPRAVTEEDR